MCNCLLFIGKYEMKDVGKTKNQLVNELVEIRQRIIELEASNTQLKEWINTFDTFVARYDKNGILLFCNEAPIKAGGLTPDDVLGKYFPDTKWWSHSEVERAKIVECFERAKAGLSSRIETNFRSADGTPFPVIFNCQPVIDEEDNIKYITAEGKVIVEETRLRMELEDARNNLERKVKERTEEVSGAKNKLEEDVAERKQMEENLRRWQRDWGNIFQSIGHPTVILDPTYGIIEANLAVLKAVDKSVEELLGKKCYHIFHGTDEPPNSCPMERMATSQNLETSEMEVETLDGIFLVSCTPVFDEAGHIEKIIHIATDITERKRAEEERKKIQAQLLQSQKMEAIGILAGGVAHDFNNLLTTIQGYTDLLMMEIDDADPMYRNLKQIHFATGRGADLTRQLLLFSRKQPMELTTLNINRTINDLLKMLNRLIGEDITIITDLKPDLWMVRADAGNIEQVIMNLAVNARDAMQKGGRLTIKTENAQIDEDYCMVFNYAHPGKFVCVSVSDTGVGIDKENIQRIFEPFFSTKEAGKGTGLGLSVVYGIVKQHDGWTNVYSESGYGSTFKIYLPAFSSRPVEETEETISLQELQGSGERILLVEDDEGVREFATMALQENGYFVFGVASAKEAMDVFEREGGDFDLLFIDVVLPDKNGILLADQILIHNPKPLVLLTSGYIDHKSQRPLMQERGFLSLQKPYSLIDLLRTIRKVIEPG